MASGWRNVPGAYMTAAQKLTRGIWPWESGVRARLPLHYKKRLVEKYMTEPAPVHYKPDPRKYQPDKWGNKLRVENVPIPIIFPEEANEGLWGGEGIIQGLRKKDNNPMKPRTPQIWRPWLTKRAFYSEILDRWMEITVTKRAMDMIDDAYGFDHYILKTHEVDICSTLGMRLKREMLLCLACKSFDPTESQLSDDVFDKYKRYVIPENEAEWVGLSLQEAEWKQTEKEGLEKKKNTKPLKEAYLIDLVEKIKANKLEDEFDTGSESFLSKLNPFQDQKQQKPPS